MYLGSIVPSKSALLKNAVTTIWIYIEAINNSLFILLDQMLSHL